MRKFKSFIRKRGVSVIGTVVIAMCIFTGCSEGIEIAIIIFQSRQIILKCQNAR